MRLRRSGRRPSRLALLAPQGDGRHRSLSRRVRARALPTTTENSHPLAKNRGKRSAERPSNHCPRIADKSTQSAQTNRGALAFRRSTAALASAVATASGSAPEPRFLGRGWGGCFARLGPVQSSELLADRSFCRPSGAPKPPGSGLQIRSRAPPLLRFSGMPRESDPRMSKVVRARNTNGDDC
jgi:hypothetical protein